MTDYFSSLIEHYPNFNARLRASLRMLVGEEVEKRVDIGMAKDGSGVGGTYRLSFTISFPNVVILQLRSVPCRPSSKGYDRNTPRKGRKRSKLYSKP